LALLLGSLVFLMMGGCGDSNNDTAAPPAPPPNTPSRATARADDVIKAMSLDQKIQQIYNLPVPNKELPGCEFTEVGRHIEGIPELKIPTFRFGNGGTGIRGGDCLPEPTATGLPSGIAAAATFDPQINFEWGQVLSNELRGWAHQSLWGPAFNMIRTPYGGRNHEYMSEDPYLVGVTATQQVLGIQSSGKTHATVKHFAGNESEYQRERWTAASRIPAQAMHEIYLLPFEMTIKDGKAASVMCAFPHLNFEWACESAPLLKQTLQERWGFDGYIVSDRRAMHSTAPSIRAGVAMELDFEPMFYTNKRVKEAIDARRINEADIDHLLRGRYRKMFEFGHFDEPYNAFLPTNLEANAKVGRRAADASIVLLKNDGLLPLQPSVTSVALVGADWFAGAASLPPRGGDRDSNTYVVTPYTVTPKKGLENTLKALKSSASVTYNNGRSIDEAVKTAGMADVAIVMVGDISRESWDKTTLSLPTITGTNQEALVPRVLKANPNTVVVLKTAGMVLMPWLPQARAVIEAWNPGQDDGNVVADVLFGVTNPSGKLPVTFGNTANEAAYATEAQYPGVRENNGLGGEPGKIFGGPAGFPQLVTHYSENLEMGYRWYLARNVTPVFPFGHGLSYTTFAYSDLSLTPSSNAAGQTVLTVEYTITNTGKRAGKEASQVYLTLPAEAAEPSKRLAAFQKVELQPGATQRVSVTIDCGASSHPFSYFAPANAEDLKAWAEGNWVTPNGQFTVHVGGSSAETPLVQPVPLSFGDCGQKPTGQPTQ
jgi:beta-glucosidase